MGIGTSKSIDMAGRFVRQRECVGLRLRRGVKAEVPIYVLLVSKVVDSSYK